MTLHEQPKTHPLGKHRVMVIGLDSADPDLVLRWSQEGRLPFLHSLMQSGVWTRLISTHDLFNDSPWPTFNIGVSPGKHGFYNHIQFRRGTTEIFRGDARSCHYLPFWWLLRGAGKKVAVFDVPKTYPLPGIDGVQIIAWGEHYPLLKQSSLPAAIAQELTARFGRYPHPPEVTTPKRISQETRLYETYLRNMERKLQATQFLLAQDDWDLFFSVFAEAHYAGHQLYHHFDPSHWAHEASRAARLGEALPQTYTRLDTALAAFLRSLPEETTLFLVSVHGIATNYSGNHLMPTVLEKLGFQKPPSAGGNGNGGKAPAWDWTRALREALPDAVRAFINERLVPESVHDKMHARQFVGSIDWRKTTAFFLPSDHFQGFISINLKGREPWGTVGRGAEYDEVCNQLSYELKRLMNPDTGRSAVQGVVQVDKVYSGAKLYDLPDLVVQWAEDGPIKRLYHPTFGVIADAQFQLRKAQHSSEGFLIAAGKHIKKGAVLTGASTMDLAPTVLHLMGQTVPRDMDGKVLLDLLNDDFTQNNPVRYGDLPLVAPQEMRL
jgi:predicted AlkP superfamily phosphohydrolase/phosphomutase